MVLKVDRKGLPCTRFRLTPPTVESRRTEPPERREGRGAGGISGNLTDLRNALEAVRRHQHRRHHPLRVSAAPLSAPSPIAHGQHRPAHSRCGGAARRSPPRFVTLHCSADRWGRAQRPPAPATPFQAAPVAYASRHRCTAGVDVGPRQLLPRGPGPVTCRNSWTSEPHGLTRGTDSATGMIGPERRINARFRNTSAARAPAPVKSQSHCHGRRRCCVRASRTPGPREALVGNKVHATRLHAVEV